MILCKNVLSYPYVLRNINKFVFFLQRKASKWMDSNAECRHLARYRCGSDFTDLGFDCKTACSCLADVGIGQLADRHRNRSAYGQHG